MSETFRVRNQWIVLRVLGRSSAFYLSYEDDRGNQRDPSKPDDPGGWTLLPSAFDALSFLGTSHQIFGPVDLTNLMQATLDLMPGWQTGPHATGPVPAPVFVDPPAELWGLPWELFIQSLLPSGIDKNRFQFVRLAKQKPVEPRPFGLPFHITAIGVRGELALKTFRGRPWYADNSEVQEHGIQIETIQLDVLQRVGVLPFLKGAHDIVVAEERDARLIQNAVTKKRGTEFSRPRLIILIGDEKAPFVKDITFSPTISLLRLWPLQELQLQEMLKEFLYGIVHDYPLHEALKSALRKNILPEERTLLITDQESNHDLRISSALSLLQDEMFTLNQSCAMGDLDGFIGRIDFGIHDLLEKTNFQTGLFQGLELRQPLKAAVRDFKDLQIQFGQESQGLSPLAQAVSNLNVAKTARENVKQHLNWIISNSRSFNLLQKNLDRRVDAALEEVGQNSTYQPIDPKKSLLERNYYRLRIHIGRRMDESLILGDIPPLDPLLPIMDDAVGHNLDVVVFEKDFTLLSPRVQPLLLPPLSGTGPVYFHLQAPETTKAELRFGIYYKNHLLQSFVLTSSINKNSQSVFSEPQVTVRLVFSRTARFGNLDKLGKRELSIAINKSGNGESHSFMFKRNTEAQPVQLAESLLKGQIEQFRKLLDEATYDKNKAVRLYPTNTADFEEMFRKLADFGASLHRGIFKRSSRKMKDQLREVAASMDETIQVVRHDVNAVFPWSAVYDYGLPQKIAGAQPSPVCLGDASGAKSCSHSSTDSVYCVYGFWGIRHRIEQLLDTGENPVDSIDSIDTNLPAKLCLAIGIDDEHTQALSKLLHKELGQIVADLQPQDDLLGLLWDSAKRPAVLLVLAHLDTTITPGEPEVPRIVLAPQKWLTEPEITKKEIDDGSWEQPKTLIMLLSCSAGATEVSTLNDFVTAFNSVGAGAIVGTEFTVYTPLLSEFARQITQDLWTGVRLGDAVKNFNRRILSSRNPLGLVFNYIGDADLRIIKKENPT